MTDTPETDAFFMRKDIDWDKEVEFCCKMERNRNEWKEVAEGSLLGAIKERDEAIQARKVSAADWLNQIANADLRVTRIKRERDEARFDLAFRRELCAVQELQLAEANKTILELQHKTP